MTIRRVGIVVKPRLRGGDGEVSKLTAWLHQRGVDAVDDRAVPREQIPKDVDLVVVLGGDGTLLAMADRIGQAQRDIPILGVNFGSLGFLTEIRIDELYTSLAAVLDGTAAYDERMMLQAEARRAGQPADTRIVLNDVVLTKAALSRMIELSISVSGSLVTRVKADGLIIASPTGSTAYNLSAGGPIVHPVVDALLLTPIAPHTLTNRPVIIPATGEVEVLPLVESENDDVFVTYDGQTGYKLHRGDSVVVRRAPHSLRLVKAPARSYFEVLREKLKWGER